MTTADRAARRARHLLPAPTTTVGLLVCSAKCGTPLHPAAAAGGHTTHPGCDPDADTDAAHRRYLHSRLRVVA